MQSEAHLSKQQEEHVRFIDWLSIVSGIVGIAGFLFAVWVWQRSDTKVREITSAVQSLHDIADSAIWEAEMLPGDDNVGRLAQLEKSIGLVSAIRTVSAKYVDDHRNCRATELGALIQRGVIWSNAMLTRLEPASDVQCIWLLTHDLEPDLSEHKTGNIVKSNLGTGTRYTYFHPMSLKSAEEKRRRLCRNIGAENGLREMVEFISVTTDSAAAALMPSHGNTILFFKDDPSYGTDLVFEEVVLHKVDRRGLFWQECRRDQSVAIFDAMTDELAMPRS